jgi:arylsulfatase
VEEAYVHNQGFDEVLFSVYNQAVSLWNMGAEAMNAVIGLFPQMLQPNPYTMDNSMLPNGWVMTLEGKKGQQAREWGVTPSKTDNKDFLASEKEFQARALKFIRNATAHDKPFYAAVWPLLTSFIPSPKKNTRGRALLGEAIQNVVEPNVAEIMDLLKELGIDDNTLVIAMADNGPMSYHPPPGSGFAETVFRGGKGDYLEGGVRVPAMMSWPGVVEEGSIIGDMLHVTDLFTTFARLANVICFCLFCSVFFFYFFYFF